jgi:hypothetical protein
MDMEFTTTKMEAVLPVYGKMIEKMEILRKKILKEETRMLPG